MQTLPLPRRARDTILERSSAQVQQIKVAGVKEIWQWRKQVN